MQTKAYHGLQDDAGITVIRTVAQNGHALCCDSPPGVHLALFCIV
jgi:hypothetical protein